MKVISLNIWGGRAGEDKVLSFLSEHKNVVDVFCLQEVWAAPYHHLEGVDAGGRSLRHDEVMVYGKQRISELLTDYTAYFHPQYLDDYGLLLMVHNKHKVIAEGEVFVHLYKGYVPELDMIGKHARNVQYVTIGLEDGAVTIMNFHGLWNGQGKTDTPERLVQSDNIVAFLETLNTPVIFCGDFNLLPDTESIKKIEESGLINLIKEYGITSTRTSYYPKPLKFADYMFVSSELKVKDFQVLADEVSDHSPLFVEVDCPVVKKLSK